MKRLTFVVLALLPFFSFADDRNIIAIVNDEPITKYEFNARKNLMIKMFNVDMSRPGIDAKINHDIINALIEGSILKQHAVQVGAVISDAEINNTIAMIEKQNNMPVGGLLLYLKSNNLSVDSFIDQINVERIKYNITGSISNSVNVSQQEIETGFILNSDKDFAIDSWIFTGKDNSALTYKKMTKLKSRIKNCDKVNEKLYTEFAEAKKFDKNLKRIQGRLQSIVQDTKEGKFSSVFKDNDQFIIVLVCKKRPIDVSEQETGQLKYFLTNYKTSKKAEKFLSDIKKKAYVKIIDNSF